MGCRLSRQVLALGNLCSSVAAALLSTAGAALSACSACGFTKVVAGLGGGADELDEAVMAVTALAVLLVLLNFAAAVVSCASTFDCGMARHRDTLQALTTSRSLCCGHILVWSSFLVQLLLTQVVLVATVVVMSLLYVCHAGKQVQYNSQQLVDEIVNEINAPDYDERGLPVGHIPDTPLVSMRDLIAGLDIHRFCVSGRDLGYNAAAFYVGCLLVSAAQALMAASLWGESQRVAVHESNELGAPYVQYTAGSSKADAPAMPRQGSGRYLQDACSNTRYPYMPAVESPVVHSERSSMDHFRSQVEHGSPGLFQREEQLSGSARGYSLDFRERDSKVEYF
mmetsp:Transcript_43155/g.125690  ORF Transcript_43155/g.125690 Transcript_43155/m.125690 type:complete len:339 (-) Transcript_43155:259-1275(-)